MIKFLSKKTTLLFSIGVLLLSSQFLKAEETSKRDPNNCYCWKILFIVEHCNAACGDGDLLNGENSNGGSGWNWFP